MIKICKKKYKNFQKGVKVFRFSTVSMNSINRNPPKVRQCVMICSLPFRIECFVQVAGENFDEISF